MSTSEREAPGEKRMQYILEIEIFDHDSKRVEIMTRKRELPIRPEVGHAIVVDDEVDRVAAIIQDTDQDTVIVRLDRRSTTNADPDFDSIIRRYRKNSWTPLKTGNGGGVVENIR